MLAHAMEVAAAGKRSIAVAANERIFPAEVLRHFPDTSSAELAALKATTAAIDKQPSRRH